MILQMDPLLKRYLDELRSLKGQNEEQIAHLLARYLQEAIDDSRSRTFLQAERFFYQKQYKEALQNYLQTKESAPDPFFSYRASACLLAERGQVDKALEFAKRALSIYAKDPDLLTLLHQQGEEAKLEHVETENPEEDLDAIAGFGVEPPTTAPISFKVPALSKWEQTEWAHYLAQYGHKNRQDETLYLFDGFPKKTLHTLVNVPHYQSHGGFFLRWKGEGIALNPGIDFLDHLHKEGFSLRDIDVVIITSSLPDSCSGLRSIYEGHCQLHRASPSAHTIHYYIASLGASSPPSWLRPRFRQEAYSIHPLELYWDGEEGECRRLSDTLTLHYFRFTESSLSCLLHLHDNKEDHHEMDRRIDHKKENHNPITIGYLPHSDGHCHGHSAIFKPHTDPLPTLSTEAFKGSTILLTGLTLSPSELERIHPKLAIFCEQTSSEGDTRLTRVGQARKMLGRCNTVILPADITLKVGLNPLCVYCSRTGTQMNLESVHVLPPLQPFGTLEYTQNAL